MESIVETTMDRKEEIRAEIDKIDKVVVESLVKRINYVLEILKYKKNEEEIKGCDRVQIVLDKVGKLAVEADGNEEIIIKIYRHIIDILTEMQLEIFKGQQEADQK